MAKPHFLFCMQRLMHNDWLQKCAILSLIAEYRPATCSFSKEITSFDKPDLVILVLFWKNIKNNKLHWQDWNRVNFHGSLTIAYCLLILKVNWHDWTSKSP